MATPHPYVWVNATTSSTSGYLGQHLLLDAANRVLDGRRDALHGRGDAEDVPRAHRAVGVPVALEREALEGRKRLRNRGGERGLLEPWGAAGIPSTCSCTHDPPGDVADRDPRSRPRTARTACPIGMSHSATLCDCGTASRSVRPDGEDRPGRQPFRVDHDARRCRRCARECRAGPWEAHRSGHVNRGCSGPSPSPSSSTWRRAAALSRLPSDPHAMKVNPRA